MTYTSENLVKVMDLLPNKTKYSWCQFIWIPLNLTHKASKGPYGL